jgi:glycosyltransferase involved in cell wall biosynthesis
MARRIPILEFVTSFAVGGTERQFVNLVRGLRADPELDVHVACFRAEGELQSELCGGDTPLREYPFDSLKSPRAARQLHELVRSLKRHRIEVVHATGLYPNLFTITAAWLARTPVIIASIRDQGHMWSPRLRQMQRHACRLADVVVTNADAIADQLRAEGYDPARTVVIRNGVVPARGARTNGSLRNELRVPPDVPFVGVVCRVDRLKGLEDFMDAAALVLERHPRARFAIVGPPSAGAGEEYVAELRQRAERMGLGERIVLTGLRRDVTELLEEIDVAVLSTLSEGLSNSLLEAMHAGRPVVATNVGGNPEIVRDGVTGLLVPPGDPVALAAAIGRLLESPQLAAAMGSAGKTLIEERFSCERMVEQTADLYRRSLRKKAGAGNRMRSTPATGPLRARHEAGHPEP